MKPYKEMNEKEAAEQYDAEMQVREHEQEDDFFYEKYGDC
jgi:hypothetical protein